MRKGQGEAGISGSHGDGWCRESGDGSVGVGEGGEHGAAPWVVPLQFLHFPV